MLEIKLSSIIVYHEIARHKKGYIIWTGTMLYACCEQYCVRGLRFCSQTVTEQYIFLRQLLAKY